MENTKIFDQKLFEENDQPARDVIKKFYGHLGIVLVDNPSIFGVDLVGQGSNICVEVERRLVWDKDEFPYDTINFLKRKTKFIINPSYTICEYAIVSSNLNRVGIIDRDRVMAIISSKPSKQVRNRFVEEGEQFYEIPKDQFAWFTV
jgi:hypothetical protein